MKPLIFLPPVVALLIVGGWVGTQRRTLSVLEQETIVLRQRLADGSAGTGADAVAGKYPGTPGKAAKDSEVIDWKKIAASLADMQGGGGMGDMRAMMRLQKQLMSMDRDELAAALKEIATLDLPANSRSILEMMLFGPLVEKDPQFALTTFVDRIGDERSGMSWQLSNALGEWAKRDLGGATAWLDQQIAEGKLESKSLDGKSRMRMQFEGTLIGALLSSDPAAAGVRLAALPADQRLDVIRNYGSNSLKEEDQAAYAELVRTQLPEKEQAEAIAQTASRLAWGEGYEKATDYMNRISATPEERVACVEKTVETKVQLLSQNQKITRENIDSMREWVTAQAPGSTDSVTGKALASATQTENKMEFAEAADLAVQYHDAGGGDDVLVGFLEGYAARNNKEKASELAAKISDEKRRNDILKNIK